MPTEISWLLKVQVSSGPQVAVEGKLPVEAYDTLAVLVPAGAEDFEIEVQPGGSGQVQFLLIRCSSYGTDISYKVNDTGNEAIPLDAVQFLMGSGVIQLLHSDGPQKLFFKNDTADEVLVQILVGRDATLSP